MLFPNVAPTVAVLLPAVAGGFRGRGRNRRPGVVLSAPPEPLVIVGEGVSMEPEGGEVSFFENEDGGN